MRDYSKVSPQFWIGGTGKKLRAAGAEAQIVAMYLMTCPHANMIGLFYLSKVSLAHETGLGMKGASKGLASSIEAGFCRYDEDSEVIWVEEMAAYQIAVELDTKDNRCKGVQNEYDSLPANPWLEPFYERYGIPFHMGKKRSNAPIQSLKSEAPSERLRSQEQEQEQEQEQQQEHLPAPADAAAPNPLNLLAWRAYKTAYLAKYGVEPVQNAKGNALVKQLVKRLGAEAPDVAGHYVRSGTAMYVRDKHGLALLIRDAEGLRTEWATGRTVTQTQALMDDKTETRGNVFRELIEETKNARTA